MKRSLLGLCVLCACGGTQKQLEVEDKRIVTLPDTLESPFRNKLLHALADELANQVKDKGDPLTVPVYFVSLAPGTSTYYGNIASGVQVAASELGLPTAHKYVVNDANRGTNEAAMLRQLVSEGVKAFVATDLKYSDAQVKEALQEARAAGVWVALANNAADTDGPRDIVISADHEKGAELLAAAIIADFPGKGKVARIGSGGSAARAEKTWTPLQAAGFVKGPDLIFDPNVSSDVDAKTTAFLAANPDVVAFWACCTDNGTALADSLERLNQRGNLRIYATSSSNNNLPYLLNTKINLAQAHTPFIYGYINTYIAYAVAVLGREAALEIIKPYLAPGKDIIFNAFVNVTPSNAAEYQTYLSQIGAVAP